MSGTSCTGRGGLVDLDGFLPGDDFVAGDTMAGDTQPPVPPDLVTGDLLLLYAEIDAVRYRVLDGATRVWGPPLEITTAVDVVRWIVTGRRMVADQPVALLSDTGVGTTLSIMEWSGGIWTEQWSIDAIDTTRAGRRGFDLEIEDRGSDLLVVHSDGGNNMRYRTRVLGTWSADAPVLSAPTGTGAIEWVELVARPDSKEIALIYSNSDFELYGLIWDGQAFIEPEQMLENAIWMVRLQSFAAAYEAIRGDLVVVWGNVDDPYWSAKLASGGGFSPKAIHPNVGRWMAGYQLVPRPQSNFIGFVGLQCDLGIPCASQSSFHAGQWDGAGWLQGDDLDSGIDNNWGTRLGSRAVTIGWATANEAIAVYPAAVGTGLKWARWDMINGWQTQSETSPTPPLINPGHMEAIKLPDSLIFLVADANLNLWAKRYDGTWTDTEQGVPLVSGLSSVAGAPFAAAVRQ